MSQLTEALKFNETLPGEILEDVFLACLLAYGATPNMYEIAKHLQLHPDDKGSWIKCRNFMMSFQSWRLKRPLNEDEVEAIIS